jgi:hypothetical protein
MSAVLDHTEAPAVVPAAPAPKGCDVFERVIRARRDRLLDCMLAANLRLGNLKNQASPFADELRRLIAFYDDELQVIDRHGASLFGEGDPLADQIPKRTLKLVQK